MTAATIASPITQVTGDNAPRGGAAAGGGAAERGGGLTGTGAATGSCPYVIPSLDLGRT
jgi:hypothetical protein